MCTVCVSCAVYTLQSLSSIDRNTRDVTQAGSPVLRPDWPKRPQATMSQGVPFNLLFHDHIALIMMRSDMSILNIIHFKMANKKYRTLKLVFIRMGCTVRSLNCAFCTMSALCKVQCPVVSRSAMCVLQTVHCVQCTVMSTVTDTLISMIPWHGA